MARVLEGYPSWLQSRLLHRERSLARVANVEELNQRRWVIRRLGRWAPGHTLTVAFRGGSPELRARIEEAAQEWCSHGNLKMSFRANGKYREWRPSDRAFKADVRIGFTGGVDGGYWSLVGMDCVDRSIVETGDASMNFEGFPQDLPTDWAATVLHEFGHALGFEHEHQSPTGGCEDQFRWEDDQGYVRTVDAYGQYVQDANGRRPGIYTVLEGPPNEWSRSTVDHNLRGLRDSRAYSQGDFDPKSIMKYFFESWMFRGGDSSRCFSPPNEVLSKADQAGMAAAYPRSRRDARALSTQDVDFVQRIVDAEGPPEELRRRLRKRLTPR